jgi:AcrR family transcriptional regulator
MVNNPLCNDPSRDRLLRAAVEIFSLRGLRDATVREICAKADVNVASVNYYFRSKEVLYAEALAFAFRQADARYPLDTARNDQLPPDERLRHFIRNFLYRLLDDSHLGCSGKLIAREIADPTSALDRIVETTLRPRFKLLQEIVPQILGPGWSEADISRCIQSIIGQCLVFRHSRSLIDRMCPEIIATPSEVERTAEHIARFSLAALTGLAEDKKRS